MTLGQLNFGRARRLWLLLQELLVSCLMYWLGFGKEPPSLAFSVGCSPLCLASRFQALHLHIQHVSPITHSIAHSAQTHVRGFFRLFATLFALEGAPAAVFTAGSTLTPMEGASAAVFTAGSTLTPLEGAPAAVFTAGSCSPPRRGFFGLFATLETPDAGSLGASMGFSALRPRLVRPAGIVDVSKGRLHGLVW